MMLWMSGLSVAAWECSAEDAVEVDTSGSERENHISTVKDWEQEVRSS